MSRLNEILETNYMQLKQLWVANIRREATYHTRKVARQRETKALIQDLMYELAADCADKKNQINLFEFNKKVDEL